MRRTFCKGILGICMVSILIAACEKQSSSLSNETGNISKEYSDIVDISAAGGNTISDEVSVSFSRETDRGTVIDAENNHFSSDKEEFTYCVNIENLTDKKIQAWCLSLNVGEEVSAAFTYVNKRFNIIYEKNEICDVLEYTYLSDRQRCIIYPKGVSFSGDELTLEQETRYTGISDDDTIELTLVNKKFPSTFNGELYVMDESGNTICYNINIDIPGSESKEGINQDGKTVWIVGKNGEVIASSANGDFDMILDGGSGSKDGFYGLLKTYSGFDSSGIMIGIMDENGQWIKEYDVCEDSRFVNSIEPSQYIELYGRIYNNESAYTISGTCMFTYCGNGVFAYATGTYLDYSYGWRFYSIYDDCEYEAPVTIYMGEGVYAADAFGTVDNLFRGGEKTLIVSMSGNDTYKMYYLSRSGAYEYIDIVSEYHGKQGTNEKCTRIGEYSDGGWIYYNVEKQLMYYEPGQEPLCICSDSDKIVESNVCDFKFVDGQAEITLLGSDNQLYKAIVDKNGNYIEEPHLY